MSACCAAMKAGSAKLTSEVRSSFEPKLTVKVETQHVHPCPFCNLDAGRIQLADQHAVVICDAFPVSPGHTLIIPRRHVGTFFETTEQERSSLLVLLGQTQQVLAAELHPDGWNIGINDGPAAGQTVPHLHIHLIPRYAGDSPDPRGGVRWVLPDKADYWSGRLADGDS